MLSVGGGEAEGDVADGAGGEELGGAAVEGAVAGGFGEGVGSGLGAVGLEVKVWLWE